MAKVSESPANPTQLRGALFDGLDVLDLNQTVTFYAYTRTVLPIDGYVFWTPTGIPLEAKGSLHYSQETIQAEDETQGLATVTFTSQSPVMLFTDAPINTIYVASVAGFRYSFSQQQGLYTQAGPLYHYFGHSIQPAFASQLLDQASGLKVDLNQAVTSNSLALWLGLNGYASQFYDGFSNTGVPFFVKPPLLFPAFMVDDNETPPYGSIQIGDDDTEALQAVPLIDINRDHYQLVSDRVRITLYGLQNDACLDFIDTVNQYSVNTGHFGIMNMPVVRDATRTQPELRTRAMKKVIDYRISYYQIRVAQVARQLIKSCVPTYILKGDVL